MNLDMTFCSKLTCKNIKCERHQKPLKDIPEEYQYHPISIANFKKCEHWEE